MMMMMMTTTTTTTTMMMMMMMSLAMLHYRLACILSRVQVSRLALLLALPMVLSLASCTECASATTSLQEPRQRTHLARQLAPGAALRRHVGAARNPAGQASCEARTWYLCQLPF